MASETHAGDDVAIYAWGPYAHLFSGIVEENYIYHVLSHASGLGAELELTASAPTAETRCLRPPGETGGPMLWRDRH